MNNYPAHLQIGRDFIYSRLPYSFTKLEEQLIQRFFTNGNRRIFFVHSLPANVGAALLAMYSRLKNPRGLRGLFADSFLPQLLASNLTEVAQKFGGNELAFLRHYDIRNLDDFAGATPESLQALTEFLQRCGWDPEFLKKITASQKVRKFLGIWLDRYGHNSIARMGSLWLCAEMVSMLSIKSIEWNRPGSGFVEWSSRFVDASHHEVFPVWEIFEALGFDPNPARSSIETAFECYRELTGKNMDGVLPNFLRGRYGKLFDREDLESGVAGETFDVCGNLLPCGTLSSVGVNVSGEALPTVVKHLLLDQTPESRAIAELIVEEAEQIGATQFLTHYEPTARDKFFWHLLDPKPFTARGNQTTGGIVSAKLVPNRLAEDIIVSTFAYQTGYRPLTLAALIKRIRPVARTDFDKLPPNFEAVGASFWGRISFRSWRDQQRQGLSTHNRTRVTPYLGFYVYDKPAPKELTLAFAKVYRQNRELAHFLKNAPPELTEYAMAMGNLVGFWFAGNLRQTEFCIWQRTKPSVNHEVRQTFNGMEGRLRRSYPWWSKISRADRTPVYVFARSQRAVPLK